MVAKNTFSAFDYAVFVASLMGALGIGTWAAWQRHRQSKTTTRDQQDVKSSSAQVEKDQENAAEDLVRSKGLSLLPVALSLLASFQSAILIVGTPAEIYAHGAEWTVNMFGMMLGISIANFIFVPVLYEMNLNSIYEYFDKRYDGFAVRTVAASMSILYMLLYMGMALYAPTVALSFMTGFPQWAAILLAGGICTFYTSFGGLRGVVLTDVFQSMIIFGSLLTVFIYGASEAGGLEQVFETCSEYNRTDFFDFSVDPYERQSFWTIVSNGCFSWLFVIGATQASYQRYSSMATLSKAKQAVLLNIPANMVFIFLANFTGFILFATYATCDPFRTKEIQKIDQILPHFVMDKMGHLRGLPGIFIAGLFGGGLSTMSSGLNALASVAWEDGISRTSWGKSLSNSRKLTVIRLLGLLFGVLAVSVAFVSSTMGDIVQVNITLSNTFAAPLMTMFLVSMFLPFVNKTGVIAGAMASFTTVSWIAFGTYAEEIPGEPPLPSGIDGCSNDTLSWTNLDFHWTPRDDGRGERNIYHVSYLLYLHFGLAAGITTSIVVSLAKDLWKKGKRTQDPSVFHPLVRRFVRTENGKLISDG